MSLNANRSRLMAMTKELSLRWGETKNHWQDAKSLEFERQYLEQLQLQLNRAAEVCEKLDAIIAKVRTDCE